MTWSLVDRLRRYGLTAPEATAIDTGGARPARLTRDAWDTGARTIAAHLRPGTRVLVLLPSGPEFFVAFAGVLYAGACAVPAVPPVDGRTQFVDLATDAEVDAVVTTSAIAKTARPLWGDAPAVRWVELDRLDPADADAWTAPRTGPDDLALLQYTSGSTGLPKGVAVGHRVLTTWLDVLAERVALPPGSHVVTWVPAHHVLGLSFVLMGQHLDGAVDLFTPEDVLADPARWLGAVSAASAAGHSVLSGAPPFGYQQATATVPPDELDLSGWDAAVIGSERIRPKVLDDFAARFAPAGFRPAAWFTGYGTTEVMMGCAHHGPGEPLRITVDAAALEHSEVVPAGSGDRGLDLVACGPPGAGLDAEIVEPDTRTPCPAGRVGELWLRGPAVAQGYWRRPEQTEETFGARLADGSGPYYRTGDLAFTHDGELVICGRLSELVIIRGRNLIPQDIESSVRAADPSLARAPVAAFSVEEDDGEALVVVVAVDEPPDPDGLATTARRAVIAGHEVDPHALLLVPPGQIPVTGTGKVRHRACRQSYLDGALTPWNRRARTTTATATAADPTASIRATIAALVGDDPGTIPLDEPLIRLGLDSMGMIRLRASLAEQGLLVPIERLAGSTVSALASALVDQDDRAGRAVSDQPDLTLPGWGEVRLTPEPGARHEPFPLTELQHAYLVGRSGGLPLGGVGTHFYAEHDATGLDIDRLHAAWCRLVARHDMLRAVVSADGEQVVQSQVDVPPFPVLDLRDTTPERAGALAGEVRDELSHQVFEPDSWPLYEIRVTCLPGGVCRVHVSLDLLVLDVWSLHVLSREWRQLYEHPGTELPPLDVTFRDYVLATREDPLTARKYWQDRLDTLPTGPDLPLRHAPAALTAPPVFVRRHDRLDGPQWSKLTAFAAAEGLTPSAVLLAAYATVLGAWSRRKRFTLNLPTFNRLPLHEHVDGVIGDFTSVTLLEVDLSGADGVAGLARRLQHQLWRDLEHRAHDGVQVLRELARHHGPDAGVLAPVVFSSASGQTADGAADLPLNWLGEHVFGVSQTPQVLLDHQLIEVGDGLEYQWDTVDELFCAGTVDEMFGAYRDLLGRLCSGDDAVWRGAPPDLLPAVHRELVRAANDTDGPVPDGLLHDRLVAQAGCGPDRPAVFAADGALTFGDLYRRAAALAADLRAAGVVPNELVAVALPKGAAQVVAVLGVLLAGGAYLPVDPGLPPARRTRLVELGGCRLVVCDENTDWPGVAQFVLDLGDEVPAPVDLPDNPAGPDDLAYVIFTSGSTGEPKGVAVSHRAALNTCVDVCDRFSVGREDRVLGLSSLSFDLSVWDIFGVLGAGGALVLPEPEAHRDPARWLALVRGHGVTVWNSVPALAQMYADYPRDDAGPDPLRLVLMSGDWIPVDLPERLRAVAPGARVVSLGGATEAAIWSICHEIGAVDPEWESIPYGRPLRNQRFHVLNERFQECPVHVVGELYIAGTGLAAGYHGDPVRTAASFVTHPVTGERLYRTGDLGRWRPDGTIEFLGREDHQVKVGGHRIELGEIESAITAHDGVRAAVVAALGDRHHRRLAACLVPADGSADGPRSAGALNPDAVDATDRAGMIFDEVERVEFKLARHGVRTDLDGAAVELPATAGTPERASRRRYGDRPVPLSDLAGLLECLRSHEGAAMPKYAYASAGNSYAVQVYLHVADGRVDGLAGGTYYHDPAAHRLVLIRPRATLSSDLVFGTDQQALDTAAFTLFLVADHRAVRPLYGERAARDLCLVETGLMSQLLEDTSAANDIGLCQLTVVGGADTLRAPFRLDSEHEVLHALIGGALLKTGERPAEADHRRAATALVDDVRAHLAARLPGYMVPDRLVTAERLPLTPTGKVDRGALERMVAADGEDGADTDASPPAGELETAIADVFAEVLELDSIGGGVRFFDLGADSTAIVQAYRLLRSRLHRTFPLTAMFEHGSVRALAAALSSDTGTDDDAGRDELLAAARHRAGLTRAARRRQRPATRVPATREETA